MSAPLSQVVIFGASGDLTARKLIPALLGNQMAGDLDKTPIQVIGVARREKTDASWRAELIEWLDDEQKSAWGGFAQNIFYQRADSLIEEDVQWLGGRLDELAREAGANPAETGRLYYLALKPSLFGGTVANLSAAGLLQCEPGSEVGWRRVIAEKPFGTDLQSAQKLNRQLLEYLREDQILRIDHYLGKETVQNILAFRFQNAIFEPLWNRHHIESVEISVCETVGMEGGRGGYYDTAGALRDMVQNHVLQILALVAMEPPSSMNADAVRNEKVQVFDSLGYPTPQQVVEDVVRAQYTASDARDRGYIDEEGIAEGSKTESFVAIRAGVHNWRWNGVPFFLRTGKCLTRRYSEVVLRFRKPPVDLLSGTAHGDLAALRPNALRLLIQPVEGIRLQFMVKEPGSGHVMRPASLGFNYGDMEGAPESPPAYQRLLLDALTGNATLFIRGDEVEAAWRFADAIRKGWDECDPPVYTYPAGSMGPAAADGLFHDTEGVWGHGVD